MRTQPSISLFPEPDIDVIPPLRTHFRAAFRLCGFLALLALAAIEWGCAPRFYHPARDRHARAAWLQRLCRRLLRLLNVQVIYDGAHPRKGLLVCNHLSYLDIIILAARHPMAFVAKKKVADWPLIGVMAQLGGTLFIDREQRRDVARTSNELSRAIAHGVVVCVFPEGTSSGGVEVLPFRPSLFQPAVEHGWTVAPARIAYALEEEGGAVAEEVCYWRDMSFLPHFLNLLGKRSITARVSYGSALTTFSDRKQLAARAHAEVRGLAATPALD